MDLQEIKPSLMIVDDDVFLRELLWVTIWRQWISFCTARDWIEAVEMATKQHFDVILMDIDMPRMDWIEATRKIKWFVDNDTMVLWFSWYLDEKRRKECMKVWMHSLYEKPKQMKEVITLIKAKVENVSKKSN